MPVECRGVDLLSFEVDLIDRPDDRRASMLTAIVDPGRILPPWLRRVVDRPSVARANRARIATIADADHRATCRRPSPGRLPSVDADRDRRSRTNLAALVAMDGRSSVRCPDDCRQAATIADAVCPDAHRCRPSRQAATIPDADRYGLTIAPTLRMIVAHCRSCRKVFAKSVSNSPIDAYPFLSASAERLR